MNVILNEVEFKQRNSISNIPVQDELVNIQPQLMSNINVLYECNMTDFNEYFRENLTTELSSIRNSLFTDNTVLSPLKRHKNNIFWYTLVVYLKTFTK